MQDGKSQEDSENGSSGPSFMSKVCSFELRINGAQKIEKKSKQISGIIRLVPRVLMLNIPIQVSILGQSQCTVFEEKCNQSQLLVKDWFEGPSSFQIHETEQELAQRRNQAQRCLQTTQFLSESFGEKQKQLQYQANKQIFLEGKQQLYQLNTQNQQKIKILLPNTNYEYPFTFYLPPNLPLSIKNQIFPGVHLFIKYKIEAGFQLDQKFIVCQESITQTLLQQTKKVTIFQEFQIRRSSQQCPLQTVTNKLTFKHFHPDGQIQSQQSSFKSCCIRGLCPSIWRREYSYDLYHCELLCSISKYRIMHLTVRVYLQPKKDKLDIRKIKRGRLYMTNKSGEPESDNSKTCQKIEMTSSKIVQETQNQSGIRISQVRVKFYGEILGIKKIMIFQKVVTLNRANYDSMEAQLILQLQNSYFSEKNELFEIRYWFQIQPLSDHQIQPQIIQQANSNKQESQKQQKCNEFDMTFSKLAGNANLNKAIKQKQKQKPSSGRKRPNLSKSLNFKIQKVEEQTNFLQF